MLSKSYNVYILASKPGGTLYVGVTNDLIRRVFEHRNDLIGGFTKRYAVHDLVYFEQSESIEAAIACEKKLKRWPRQWKVALIERVNPSWRDLYAEIAGP